MWARITSNDIWAKALRILLVFSLVFGLSFHIESLAFAKVVVDNGSGHENETLESVTVYGLVTDNGETKLGSELGKTGGTDDIQTVPIKAGNSIQVAAVAKWEKATDEVEVPDVVDKTFSEAVSILEEAGFHAVYENAHDEDIVTATDPEGGKKVPKGSDVRLTLKEPEVEKVEVPDVVDKTFSEAVSILEEAGFNPVYEGAHNEDVVTATDPRAGEEAPKGSDVRLALKEPETNTDTTTEPTTEPTTDTTIEPTAESDGSQSSGTESIETESAETESTGTKGISPQSITMHAQAEDDGEGSDSEGDSSSSKDVVLSNFLKWTSDNAGEDGAISLDVDQEAGKVTIKGLKPGKAKVTCSLPDELGDIKLADGVSADDFKVEFEVEVEDASKPYISSIELYRTDGADTQKKLDDTEEVVLTEANRAEDGTLSLNLRTKVIVYEKKEGESEATPLDPIELEPGESLKEKSKDKKYDFDDLEWILRDKQEQAIGDDVATINQGKLSLKNEDVPVVLLCKTADKDGDEGKARSQQITVLSEKAKQKEGSDIQGEANPQPSLTVTIDDPAVAASSDAENASGETNSGNSGESASSEGQPADTTAPEGENASGDAENSASSAAAAKEVSKTFTANDDGEILDENGEAVGGGARTETYTMDTAEGGNTVVEGRGTTLQALFEKAGISLEDQQRIDSVDFISAKDGVTHVVWSDLVSNTHENLDYIMVAPLSYVHELNGKKASDGSSAESSNSEQGGQQETSSEGEENPTQGISPRGISPQITTQEGDEDNPDATSPGADDNNANGDTTTDPTNDENTNGSGETGASQNDNQGASDGASGNESSEVKLLSNTRFRVLYAGSVAGVDDPLKLRYIKQIIVHLTQPEDKSPTDAKLKIHIDYVPTPKGENAILTAVPNSEVGASQFNYTWEISENDRKTWKVYNDDSVQTLRVMTDDPPAGHIGHWFRVILKTDLKNEDGSERGATSEPVQIHESTDFAVKLAYDPPIAGDYATFTAELVNAGGIDSHSSSVTYVWEMNMGKEWEPIPGAASAPTWSTKTNPIEPSDANNQSSDAEPVTMTYIRVRATTSDGKTAVSNAQPLTVRVGETGEPKDPTIDIPTVIEQDSTGDGNTPGPKVNINPVESLVYEDTDDWDMGDFEGDFDDGEIVEDDDEGDSDETATNPATVGKSPEIVVNNKMSQKIKQQNKAAKEKKQSETPGARWTEISTMNPSQQDLQRIFANNPFAPFAIPTGLGLIFAGGLEKLLAFRRQL